MDDAFLFVHSPLMGPSTWAPVAAAVRSRGAAAMVPDLSAVASASPPFWAWLADAVVDAHHLSLVTEPDVVLELIETVAARLGARPA